MPLEHIDPYSLLGVDYNSTLDILKKAYYELSLICHPDRGGNNDDMIVVHNAYIYIKDQFENCKNTKDFETFCKEQETIPPSFREIFEYSDMYINHKKFNEKFEKTYKYDSDPFKKGYGDLMDKSEIKPLDNVKYSTNIDDKKLKNNFNKLIKYVEPTSLPDSYGKYHRFGIEHIENYSETVGNMYMTDYSLAFTEPDRNYGELRKEMTLEELIKEREKIYY